MFLTVNATLYFQKLLMCVGDDHILRTDPVHRAEGPIKATEITSRLIWIQFQRQSHQANIQGLGLDIKFDE